MDAKAPRKPALGFIFVTLVLLMLGVGIIIPVLPGLTTQFEGGNVAEGSGSYGWLLGVFSAMQFVASPILGSLSDRFGRRKVILVALAGLVDRLRDHGVCPKPRVALCRPDDLGGHGRVPRRLQRLHCGRHPAGEEGAGLRHGRRGLRPRVRDRAGHRGASWDTSA